MKTTIKKNNYRIITIVTYMIISILALSMTINYILSKEKSLLEKKYSDITLNVKDKINSLIDKKKNATLALTITLANNTEIVNILNNPSIENDKLKRLSLLLRKETDFKNVWFQIIDKKGVSLFRSWSDKKGDEIYKVRSDLKEMVSNPKIRSSISVGKYDMTFKAMVPVFENGEFLGLIESITHFNSISRGLRISDNIEPLIIVEEKFTKQLKYPFTRLFIDNHYIANISAKKEIIDYIQKLGVKNVIESKDYIVDDKYIVINTEIKHKENKLASFIVLKELDLIDVNSISEFKSNTYLYLGLFIALLGLILYIISYSIYSKELTKLYDELNRNQEDLKKLNESLKQTVDEEILKNDEKNRVLFQQSKLAAMGEMIGNIAHQWRQPLSIITTAASGIKLKKELGISEEKEEVESLISIIDSANYLSNTIDDFRYFFSPNKQKVVFNTSVLIDKVMNLIEIEYRNKNIGIIKEIDSFEIETFENELLQVVLNLISNARDELLSNSDLDKKLIFIKIYKDEQNSCFEILDNAGGVPINIIDRIFEPYFTTKHQSQGTGIGLYMSEEIISKHMNGTLTVKNKEYDYENKKYTGACFRIEIPK